MLKNKKGISLTTMVITVFIMFLIIGTLVYSAVDSIKIRKLNKLYNDLRQLDDAVEIYYLKNGKLPIKGNVKEIELNSELSDSNLSFTIKGKNTATSQNDFFNPNDLDLSLGKAQYYEVDVNLMDNISLNYPTNTYIVNVNSHTVYNYSGFTVGGKTYYALPLTYKDIQYKENNAVTNIKLKNVAGITDVENNNIYLAYTTDSIDLRDYLIYDSANGEGLGEPKEFTFSYVIEPTTKYYNLDENTGILTRNSAVVVENIEDSYSNLQIQITVKNYDGSVSSSQVINLKISSINIYTTENPPELVEYINLAAKKEESTYKDLKTITGDNEYCIHRNGESIYASSGEHVPNPQINVITSNSEIANARYTKKDSGIDFGNVKFESGTQAGSENIKFQVDGYGNATDVVKVNVFDFKIYEEEIGSNINISKLDFGGTGALQSKTVHLNIIKPQDFEELKYDGERKNIEVSWSEVSYNPTTKMITTLDEASRKTNIEVTNYINAKITPKSIGTTYLLCEYKIVNEKGDLESLGKSLIPITIYGEMRKYNASTDSYVPITSENIDIASNAANKTIKVKYFFATNPAAGTEVTYENPTFKTSNNFSVVKNQDNSFTITYNSTSDVEVESEFIVKVGNDTHKDSFKIKVATPPATP